MNQNRLFVGNLSYQTMENDLQDYFSQAGVVTSVNLMLDKVTGKSRGFAFVEFATAEEANKAVEQFHNKEFQGRALTVNVARPAGRARTALGGRAAKRRRGAGLIPAHFTRRPAHWPGHAATCGLGCRFGCTRWHLPSRD